MKDILFLALFALFFGQGCAKLPMNSKKVKIHSLNEDYSQFVGTYKLSKPIIPLAIEMIDRSRKGYRDFRKESEYQLQIHSVSKSEISFSLLENDSEIMSKIIPFKVKKDNFLYLKNHNVQRHNIPFILGGLDINRTQIALTEKGNLLFENAQETFGAFLIVFMAGTPNIKHSKVLIRNN